MKFDLTKGLDIANMDEKTVEILTLMGKGIEDAIDGYLKDTMSKKDFEQKLNETIQELGTKAELKACQENLDTIKGALLKMKGAFEKGADGQVQVKSIDKQIEEQLKEFITNTNGRKTVDLRTACSKGLGNKKTINLVLDMKDAATAATITSAGIAPHFSHSVDNVLSVEPRANTILRQYANVAPIGTRSLTYAEFVAGEGDAEWVKEGGAKPLMDGTLTETTINVAKVALGAKLTEETLTDLPQLVAEIRAEIINKIGLKEEAGILSGSGLNGELKGVQGELPAYNLTSVKIANAGIVDAIVAAYTQIINNSNQSYVPNVVLINPIDWANMSREKDTTGRPLNENISEILPTGLNIVTSTAIPQGKLLIGDFAYLNIRDYVELQVTFGWENDDFTKNLVTMIGEKRLMAYIKKQYKHAFVYDTIANIKTALATA